MEHVISFSPTGAVKAMHCDTFSLGFLGPQRITRASDIRWNEEDQAWGIWFNENGEFQPPFDFYKGFATYEAARDFEVKVMNFCLKEQKSPIEFDIYLWAKLARGVEG
jgi:hypothetical protein